MEHYSWWRVFKRRRDAALLQEAKEEISRIGLDATLARVEEALTANWARFNRSHTGIPMAAGFELHKLTRHQERLLRYRDIVKAKER